MFRRSSCDLVLAGMLVATAGACGYCRGQFAVVMPAQATPPAAATNDKAGPPANPTVPMIHLANGDFAPGALKPSDKPDHLSWQSSAFTDPFLFPTDRVLSIHWPQKPGAEKPQGAMSFELTGGDTIVGDLTGLDAKTVEINSPRLGRFKIDRTQIVRILQLKQGGERVYVGPSGLAGWQEYLPPGEKTKGWREESGQILTERDGASIQTNVGLPERAVVEFELSWTKKPDFLLAIGTSEAPGQTRNAFRFEIWGKEIIVEREIDNEADVEVVQPIEDKAGRVKLTAYIDQAEGSIAVFSREGARLCKLKLKGSKPTPLGLGVLLQSLHGDLRLEWLRVTRWVGELPRELKSESARVLRQDGTSVYCDVKSYDAASRVLVIKDKDDEKRLPLDQITSISLATRESNSGRLARVLYEDGARLSGTITGVESDAVKLTVPGVATPLRLPLKGMRSLLILKQDAKLPKKEAGMGKLELDGLLLTGKLVDGANSPQTSCLTWKPILSETASAIKPDASGRIIYREPPPQQPQNPNMQTVVVRGAVAVAPAQPAGVGGMMVRFAQALGGAPSTTSTHTAKPQERKALFLKDGDVVPAVIKSVDEKGVTFSSSLSSQTFVPHEKLKAVELVVVPPSAPIRLTRSKRDRLLILPRMQRPSPPTQLIRSVSGDYLRGRVIRLDDKALEVEIHLETKIIPRDRIAQIIWLHPEELAAEKKTSPEASTPAAKGTLVQAVRNDGVRITFQADRVVGDQVKGTSEVLGPCQVELRTTDQLLIGQGGVKKGAVKVPYQQWKLTNAVDPKYLTASEGGEGGESTGAESPLVDKPAPDFTLELLDGKKFHLAESKGKIVMLDFWATWCGPCIQAMPQVEKVAKEFAGQGVTLVAVNLQETPEQIKSMLERHKLEVNVALDREGLVAEKYKAVAIPQTVIIDKDGKVARLFVGGGPRFDEQLRQALKAVISGVKAPRESAAPVGPDEARATPKPRDL